MGETVRRKIVRDLAKKSKMVEMALPKGKIPRNKVVRDHQERGDATETVRALPIPEKEGIEVVLDHPRKGNATEIVLDPPTGGNERIEINRAPPSKRNGTRGAVIPRERETFNKVRIARARALRSLIRNVADVILVARARALRPVIRSVERVMIARALRPTIANGVATIRAADPIAVGPDRDPDRDLAPLVDVLVRAPSRRRRGRDRSVSRRRVERCFFRRRAAKRSRDQKRRARSQRFVRANAKSAVNEKTQVVVFERCVDSQQSTSFSMSLLITANLLTVSCLAYRWIEKDADYTEFIITTSFFNS